MSSKDKTLGADEGSTITSSCVGALIAPQSIFEIAA
jgi:hypothetical protein